MPIDHRYDAAEPRHPIQVVARRSGLTADVIRAWERRYRAVAPRRSGTARRLYSDEDVDRLLLLRRATLLGRRIGDIAHLPTSELRTLVESDESASTRAPGAAPAGPESGGVAPAVLERSLEALRDFDTARLEEELARAAMTLSLNSLIERVLSPLLREVGDAWSNGTMAIGHEHLASALVRALLGRLREAYGTPRPGPEIVVTTPAGQLHELGALMAAVTAAAAGWRVHYLGPNLPAEEIAAVASVRRAKLVAIGIVHPLDDPRLATELLRLRERLPQGTRLLAGGPGIDAYERALRAAGAALVRDLPGLTAALEAAARPN